MVKCSICGNKLKELFLGKLKGTVVRKEGSSKKYYVCFDCQKKFKDKEEMLRGKASGTANAVLKEIK